jgi:hypothetical protein
MKFLTRARDDLTSLDDGLSVFPVINMLGRSSVS